MQRARQFAQAYSNDRRSHCVRANHRVRSFATRGRTRRGNACQTLVARTIASAAWLNLRQLQHARRRGKGAVMSLGTCWRRCLGERPLGAPEADMPSRSAFEPDRTSASAGRYIFPTMTAVARGRRPGPNPTSENLRRRGLCARWARRSELFALNAVVISQHSACSSPGTKLETPQWEIFGSVLEIPGLADRAFSYECILSPVGRSAQMPAAFLFSASSARLRPSSLIGHNRNSSCACGTRVSFNGQLML
jgi:hypothetical protein